MEFIPLIKLLAGIGAFIMTLLGIKHYGNLREDKGLTKGVNKATEENNENFKELADDVLSDDHPYGVLKPGATEVAYPELDTGIRVAPDVQGEQAGGPRGNGANTS